MGRREGYRKPILYPHPTLGHLVFRRLQVPCRSAARQLDLVAFDADHLHHDLIAFLQLIPDIANPVFGDFRNVQQAVGAGEDLDERAEIRDADDFAEIGLADFRQSPSGLEMISIALLADGPSEDAIFTRPSSETSIFTPVCSMIDRIILPPGPMTSRILSVGIFIE